MDRVIELESLNQNQMNWENNLRKILSWSIVLGVFTFAAIFFARIAYLAITEEYFKEIGLKHFPSIVGVPAAAIASILIVLTLRTVAGPLEFKIFGLEFKGASGPTAFWILCFLAICAAIRLTWNLHYNG